MKNHVRITFDSLSVNEALARAVTGNFLAPFDPPVSVLSDIKTAVSEAVTNAIVHGYGEKRGDVVLDLSCNGETVRVEVIDDGVGIADIQQAKAPFFTTCTDGTRSGMGFMVMESFSDDLQVASAPEEGTRVVMHRRLKP